MEWGLGSYSLSYSSPVPNKPYGFCGRKAMDLCIYGSMRKAPFIRGREAPHHHHHHIYIYIYIGPCVKHQVSRFGLAVRLVSGRTSVRYRFGSPFSSKRLWFVNTVLWLCPSLPTETLKWFSSLPIVVQKSFWWWQCSDRYIISLFPHLHTPSPPPPPSPRP